MRKLLMALSLCLIAGFASAQKTITFAYDVDSDGNTTSDNSKFTVRDGEEIKMLVRAEHGIGTSQLQYKIYRINCSGEKTYSTTFNYDLKSTSSAWAWKGIICHSSGYYFIEVVDYYGKHLCEGVFYVTVY